MKKKPDAVSERRQIQRIRDGAAGFREAAELIGRKLAEGLPQKDIAALLGKSQAYISNYAQLRNLPPVTAGMVDDGRVADLSSITDLAKLERRHPRAVMEFSREVPEPSRGDVRALRRRLNAQPGGERIAAKEAFPRWRRGNVVVEHDGRWAVLILEKKPREQKFAWIRYADEREAEVPVKELRIRAIVAG